MDGIEGPVRPGTKTMRFRALGLGRWQPVMKIPGQVREKRKALEPLAGVAGAHLTASNHNLFLRKPPDADAILPVEGFAGKAFSAPPRV